MRVPRLRTALGLAIARSVILGHGGTIELLDREPHGLLVRVVLPETGGQGCPT